MIDLETPSPGIPWHVYQGTLLSTIYALPYSSSLRDVAQKTSLVAIAHDDPRVGAVARDLIQVISKETAE